MTELFKHEPPTFVLPSVVDFINYDNCAAIDIIKLKDELFKKGAEFIYKGWGLIVVKVIKKYPIQTEANVANRLDILKVRYFCNKLNTTL